MHLPYLQISQDFFKTRPALVYGAAALVAVLGAFYTPYYLLCFLAFPLCMSRKTAGIAFLLGMALFLYSHAEYPDPKIPIEGVEGITALHIERISKIERRNGNRFIYRGTIQGFWDEDGRSSLPLKNSPFILSRPEKAGPRPEAHADYLVRARLRLNEQGKVIIEGSDSSSWEKIPWSFSLAEWRFRAKTAVNHYIQSQFQAKPVQSFLSGLLTGEFDDRELFDSFKELGLIHLLAISGFHFSLIASLAALLLRLVVPDRLLPYLLTALLSCYFLFLGWGPSVLRAWMTILLFYSASFCNRFSDSMNALGVALLFSLLIDPPLIQNIGFQFSFLTTAAILFMNPLCAAWIDRFFPLHPYKEAFQWNLVSKHSYIFLRFGLAQLALGMATSAFALPLSLLIFGSFPPLSIVYNLFFPSLVSLSMSLLMLGLLVAPIPWAPSIVHGLNDYFTSFLLNMTKN
jgi:competence protein ComEC